MLGLLFYFCMVILLLVPAMMLDEHLLNKHKGDKMRQRKTIKTEDVQKSYEYAIENFKTVVGKKYDPNNGWNQVKNCGEEANRAYSAVRTLEDLINETWQ